MQRRQETGVAALAAALLWLLVALALVRDYGPTWDCVIGEYPLGESLLHAFTSHGSLRDAVLHADPGELRAPHPDFRMVNPWWVCWSLGSLLSAASCRLFWTTLGWLPAVAAHHLPTIALVAVLVVILVRWTAARAGLLAGLLAPALMLASPRFFADSFSNLKDVPEAVLCVATLLVAARAIDGGGGGVRTWLAAGALAGAALAQKANGLFLPFEVAAFAVVARLFRAPSAGSGVRRPFPWLGAGGALAAMAALWFALSPQFWFDPVERLRQHYDHVFRIGNVAFKPEPAAGASVLAALRIDVDGVVQTVITTPIPILLLFLVGLFAPTLARRDRVLLAVGTLFPIARTLLPGMVNFDGVRHFDEFFPPMCVLAAAGLAWVATRVAAALRARRQVALAPVAAIALVAGAAAPGACATVRSHPHGCAWFNALVGGLPGAQRRGYPEATDYWGGSYWQGVAWLDAHAEPGARIWTPIAGTIVSSIAPVALRPDLAVLSPADVDLRGDLYVMYITRPAFYDPFVRRIEAGHPPIHRITVDGAPILAIHRFAAGEEARRAIAGVREGDRATQAANAVTQWVLADPKRAGRLKQILKRKRELGDTETVRLLREALPPELKDGAEDLLRADGGR